MDYQHTSRVKPGSRVRLGDFDPQFATKHHGRRKAALAKIESLQTRMDALQYQLYAERKPSLLICLQAPDAGGKDGVVRHVIDAMNPQGCRVVGFKEPSTEELAHDLLWRIERQTPRRGEIVIFNRSHYEDVLVMRAARQWKFSEADYSERAYWADYQTAYEDALSQCSSDAAPWFVIPSDLKWFRDLAISQIIVETMEQLGIEVPEPTVTIADIRRKYHAAAVRSASKHNGKPGRHR